jgi:hypothetical protein
LIVCRDEVAVRVRDLDVVSEDAVVPDLERCDARPLAFDRLDLRDGVLPTAPERAQFVEVLVDARADRVLITDGVGWAVDERGAQVICDVVTVVPPRRDAAERPGRA